MTAALMTTIDNQAKAMESVLIDGDLSKLSPEQRVIYYKQTCESLGLNWLTKPFAYIRLNNKLCFYVLKDGTEQLRKRDGVSIYKLETQNLDGVFVVTAYARSTAGKEDAATGAVPTAGLRGEALANALMKAETKAKRRVTLSICGLGWTDESEVDSIPNAQKVDVNLESGVIIEESAAKTPSMAALLPPRQRMMDDIFFATSLPELSKAFANAYRAHGGDINAMQDLVQMKDRRKAELEGKIPVSIDPQEGNFCDSVGEDGA